MCEEEAVFFLSLFSLIGSLVYSFGSPFCFRFARPLLFNAENKPMAVGGPGAEVVRNPW